MTRQNFIDDITTWYDLINFCSDEGLDDCDDIYDEDEKDSTVDARLYDKVYYNRESWQDVLSFLSDVPDNQAEYYVYNGDYDDFREATDRDFDERKSNVLELMDANAYWDEEEAEEEEYVHQGSENIAEEEPSEPVDFSEIFSAVDTDFVDYSAARDNTAEDEHSDEERPAHIINPETGEIIEVEEFEEFLTEEWPDETFNDAAFADMLSA